MYSHSSLKLYPLQIVLQIVPPILFTRPHTPPPLAPIVYYSTPDCTPSPLLVLVLLIRGGGGGGGGLQDQDYRSKISCRIILQIVPPLPLVLSYACRTSKPPAPNPMPAGMNRMPPNLPPDYTIVVRNIPVHTATPTLSPTPPNETSTRTPHKHPAQY